MYLTSDSLLPENQQPLMITVAPFGPQWLPADSSGGLSVPWKDQIQMAVDCYNAGATILHVHVRDPKTGHISNNLEDYGDFIGKLRHAVPKMILQVGGSTSYAVTPGHQADSLGDDTWHMMSDIDPKPDQVTVTLGTTFINPLPRTMVDDASGTQLENPEIQKPNQNVGFDDTAAFYIEHLKRLRARSIQPYFSMAHLHHLDELGHVIHTGVYMGPVNHVLTAVEGSALCRHNPIDFIEYVRRTPPGSIPTMECVSRTIAPFAAIAIALGAHVSCGIEDRKQSRKGGHMSSVQQVDQIVRLAKELNRPVATGDEGRQMLKLGVWYSSVEETLDALWAYQTGRITS